MFEFLPHPEIRATTVAELSGQINDYLFRLKEALEFELSSIDIDNLSPEFRKKLDAIGVDITSINEAKDNEMAQVATNFITIEDVIDSYLLDEKMKPQEERISALEKEVAELKALIE